MRRRLNWGILLWSTFLILVINDWENLKYFPHVIKELGKLFKRRSKYIEDGDFILIKRPNRKKI